MKLPRAFLWTVTLIGLSVFISECSKSAPAARREYAIEHPRFVLCDSSMPICFLDKIHSTSSSDICVAWVDVNRNTADLEILLYQEGFLIGKFNETDYEPTGSRECRFHQFSKISLQGKLNVEFRSLGRILNTTSAIKPYCPLNVELTPRKSDSAQLFIVLFTPRPVTNEHLGYMMRTQDISLFLRRLIPKIVGVGDKIVVFQLGHQYYENGIVMQYSSQWAIPQLYNTPSPRSTLTPEPLVHETPESGFVAMVATRVAATQLASRADAEAANETLYACEKQYWDEEISPTATAWAIRQTKENNHLIEQVTMAFDRFEIYSDTDEFYYGNIYNGLHFATAVLKENCREYSECVLILIDDLPVWGEINPDKLPIDLSGVNIYTIPTNCPSRNLDCGDLTNYWDNVFQYFGAENTRYLGGSYFVEGNLLEDLAIMEEQKKERK